MKEKYYAGYEVDAYSTQYSYNPMSVMSIEADLSITNMSSITPSWVRSIRLYEYDNIGNKTVKYPYANYK